MKFRCLIAPAVLAILLACNPAPQPPPKTTAGQAAPMAAEPTPKAPNPRFYDVTRRIDAGGSFYMYADLKDVLRSMVRSFEPMAAGGPAANREAYDCMNQALDQLGLYGIQDVAMSSLPEGDLYLNKFFLAMPGGIRGLPGLFGNGPHPIEALAYAPADTVVFFQTDFMFDQTLSTVRDMINRFKGPEAVMEFNRLFSTLDMRLGLNTELLIKSLGDRVAFVADQDPAQMLRVPNGVELNAPRIALLLSVKDDSLYQAIVQKAKANGVAGAEQTTQGLAVTAIDCPPNQIWPVSPVVAGGKNMVIVASHAGLLNEMIRASQSGGLAQTAEFRQLSAGLPTDGNGMMFVSARVFETMRNGFNQVKPRMPGEMAAAWTQVLEDPNMPRHGTYAIRRQEMDGVMMISRSGTGGQQFIGTAAVVPMAILAAIAVPNFLEAQTRSKVSRASADMRSISIAIESYGIDTNAYPASSSDPSQNFYGKFIAQSPELAKVPTFRPGGSPGMMSLTTPIQYMTRMVGDPYAPAEGATYAFYSTPGGDLQSSGWILWSPGPDARYDLNALNIREAYDPRSPASEMLINLTYDPTNGTMSPGDIWRSKQ